MVNVCSAIDVTRLPQPTPAGILGYRFEKSHGSGYVCCVRGISDIKASTALIPADLVVCDRQISDPPEPRVGISSALPDNAIVVPTDRRRWHARVHGGACISGIRQTVPSMRPARWDTGR